MNENKNYILHTLSYVVLCTINESFHKSYVMRATERGIIYQHYVEK